jgi:hypothetical protein
MGSSTAPKASPSPCCATPLPTRLGSAGSRSCSTTLGPDGPSDVPVCVDCLLELHPRLGEGLDVALAHRGAEWRDGDWVAAPELWDE